MVGHERYRQLVTVAAEKITAGGTVFDKIVALSIDGLPVAAELAPLIGVDPCQVVGLPIEKTADDYRLDFRLLRLRLEAFQNTNVLVVDGASNRGLLTKKAVMTIQDPKADVFAASCVLLAQEDGILQPDYVAEKWRGKPPAFHWEAQPTDEPYQALPKDMLQIAKEIRETDNEFNTIIAASTTGFLGAAVLSKQLGIERSNVVGLPGGITPWATLGSCLGRHTLALGHATELAPIAAMITDQKGSVHAYALTA